MREYTRLVTRRGDPSEPVPPYVADDIDRAILRLLQLDARRPFSAMAAELEVSDQTVARRYQRLRARAGVRVVAVTQPNINTERMSLFRIRVSHDLDTVAANLARRDDTAWVNVVSGPSGLELTVMVYRDRTAHGEFALMKRLSDLPDVVSVTAQSCLHMFFGGPDSLLTKPDVATSAAPTVDETWPHRVPVDLEDPDRRLLAALTVDGRAGVGQLSQASGLSQETVSRRLEMFVRNGILYFDIDFDAELLGLRSSVSLWITVAPSAVDDAGRALATHAEVSFAAATTGSTNLYATAHCTGTDELYRYLTGAAARLPGLRAVETAPLVRSVKRAGRDPLL